MYPQIRSVEPVKGAVMIVDAEGSGDGAVEGAVTLPEFTNLGRERRRVTISGGGSEAFEFQIAASEDWIQVDRTADRVKTGVIVFVTVDWERVKSSASGEMVIRSATQTIAVKVKADVIDVGGLPAMTFVETHGVVAIEADHTADRAVRGGVEWKTIDDYGKTLSSVKMFPTTVSFRDPEEAPYLEYRVFVREYGEYTLTAYTAQSNNLSDTNRLKYGVSFDGGGVVMTSSLSDDFEGGNLYAGPWQIGVMENIHRSTTTHALQAGLHVLRFHGVDAGLVLQRLVLSREPLPTSFFGPEESYYVGRS